MISSGKNVVGLVWLGCAFLSELFSIFFSKRREEKKMVGYCCYYIEWMKGRSISRTWTDGWMDVGRESEYL